MKFSSGLTIVAAALAVANTVEKRTTNNFEGKTGARLNLVSAGLGVDNGLYYKGIGLTQIADDVGPLQAINPQSSPNVLAFGNLNELDDDYPYITSIFNGQSKTFTLTSLYYGCILGNLAGNCTLKLAGYKGGHLVARARLNYDPINRQSSNMVEAVFDATFQNIDGIRLLTIFHNQQQNPGLGGATFLDDITYDLN